MQGVVSLSAPRLFGRVNTLAAARRLTVPVLTPGLSSLWIGLVTPVDAGVARPLIEGLSVETVVTDPSGMALFPGVERTPLPEALAAAVENLAAG